MLLEAEGLKYIYMPGTPFEVEALRGINLYVERGEFVGLMGSTGSGKSTLLQHLNGLLEPVEGAVKIDGEKVKPGFLWNRDVCVGLVFQHPEQQLFAETVFQEVAFGPYNQGLSSQETEDRVRRALRMVQMEGEEIMQRSPFELSRGQMRKVALAGVLSMNPHLLILDEPTSGLDPRGRREFLEQVAHLHENLHITVIMVSHRPDELIALANRLLVMHCGEIIMEGIPQKIFSRAAELRRIGLEVPPAVEFLEALRRRGCSVREDAVTEEEVCREVAEWLKGEGDPDES